MQIHSIAVIDFTKKKQQLLIHLFSSVEVKTMVIF